MGHLLVRALPMMRFLTSGQENHQVLGKREKPETEHNPKTVLTDRGSFKSVVGPPRGSKAMLRA